MALSDNQKQKVFWAGAIDHLPDPVRSTRWRMIIPSDIFNLVKVNTTNGESFGKDGGEDEFALHIKSGPKIPDVKLKEDKINYMGFEKYYPTGQDGLASTIDVECLLLEDMRAYEAMLAWNQTCFNSGVLNNTGTEDTVHLSSRVAQEGSNKIYLGLGQQENWENPYRKLLRNAAIRLELYDWMYGDVILSVMFVNAWPKSVGNVSNLSYDSAKLMSFKTTFRFDRFNLYIPPDYKVIK